MGTALTGLEIRDTYDALVKITDNGPLSGTAKYLSDGLGNDSVLALSTAQVGVGVIPAANVGNLQVGGAANASIFSQQGTDTVRAGVRASGRVGIVFDSSDATYTNRMWYLDSVGANGTLTIGRQGLDVMTFANAGNVGIGTSSPTSGGVSSTLRVKQTSDAASGFTGLGIETAAATGELLYFGHTGTTAIIGQTYLGTGAYQPIAFSVGGSERMRITSAGNVGIGTTTSTYDSGKIGSTHRFLSVQAGAGLYAVGTLAGNQSGNGDRLGYLTFVNDNNSASYKYSAWIGSEVEGTTANQQGGRLIFSTTSDASAAGPIERMRITSAGNVGIGNSAPTAKLDVTGTLAVSSSLTAATGSFLGSSANGTLRAEIAVESPASNNTALIAKTSNGGNDVFRWFDGATQLGVFKNSGNVGIGTSSPTGKLDVTKAGKGTIAVLDSTAFAAGVGGSIDLGGNYRSVGDFGAFTRIAAEKSNATDGNFGFDLGFYVTTNGGSTIGTKVATMTSAGVLDLAQGQIKFPATQVPSADPNTLDDYEEGTFTASLLGTTTNPTTAVTTTGYYTKIGNRVSVEVNFIAVDNTGASGQVEVSGLPFTSNTNSRGVGQVALFYFDFNGASYVSAFLTGNSTKFELLGFRDDNTWVNGLHNAGANRYLTANLTYFV